MHLQQNQQSEGISIDARESHSTLKLPGLSLQASVDCSFLQHYTSVQDMTDVLINQSLPSSPPNHPEQTNLVDYVDQFLWNSPQIPLNQHYRHTHLQTTTQVQKREEIAQNCHTKVALLGEMNEENEGTGTQIEEPKTKSDLSKDYRKNLAGYIVKKVIRLLLSPDYAKSLKRFCRKREVEFQTFKKYCEQSLPRLFGPNSIYELLHPSCEDDRKMKQLLLYLMTRILRKRYTLEILKEGRMKDYNAYIQVKNQGLLYFSLLLP